MKTQNTSKAIGSLIASTLLLLASASAYSADNYQLKSLFTPSHSLLKAESKGRIMIYDGLDASLIDKAMDEQFERIDNMMFTRVHQPLGDGSYEIADDGC